MSFVYRRKPQLIEAFQWTGDEQQEGEPEWIVKAIEEGTVVFNEVTRNLNINTLEGMMTAQQNDYIICGIKGEIYPCKPDIFEDTYEKAE